MSYLLPLAIRYTNAIQIYISIKTWQKSPQGNVHHLTLTMVAIDLFLFEQQQHSAWRKHANKKQPTLANKPEQNHSPWHPNKQNSTHWTAGFNWIGQYSETFIYRFQYPHMTISLCCDSQNVVFSQASGYKPKTSSSSPDMPVFSFQLFFLPRAGTKVHR